MSERSAELLLEDMLESCDRILEYTHGFRNRIVHDYFGIDYQIVWLIIENNIPELRDLIKKII
jgi:uncharacterized protein with HEPN domain